MKSLSKQKRRKQRQHGLFVQGVGAGGVHLAGQGQLYDLADALEGRVAALHADLADGEAPDVLDQVQVEHVDDAGGDLLTDVDLHVLPAHEALGLLQHFRVAHHDGTALLVELRMAEGLDGKYFLIG